MLRVVWRAEVRGLGLEEGILSSWRKRMWGWLWRVRKVRMVVVVVVDGGVGVGFVGWKKVVILGVWVEGGRKEVMPLMFHEKRRIVVVGGPEGLDASFRRLKGGGLIVRFMVTACMM